MSDMDPMAVCFLVNNEIVQLYPQDNDVRKKFRADHSFAVEKIVQLVNKGRIKLNEPISRISLLHNDYEQLIYKADTNSGSDNENIEPIVPNINEENEQEEYRSSPPTPGTCHVRTSDVWGDSETKYILDQYYTYVTQIGPMKMLRRKKDMWSRISHDFLLKYNIYKTPVQIENRYKTVLRRKKDAVNNNSKSGHSRQEVPYETELSKISGLDDSIEPELIRSPKKVKVLKKSQSQNVLLDSDDNAEDDGQQIKKKKITRQM